MQLSMYFRDFDVLDYCLANRIAPSGKVDQSCVVKNLKETLCSCTKICPIIYTMLDGAPDCITAKAFL